MRVTSTELQQSLGHAIDMARIEPVIVTKHNHDHVVILSAERYLELQQSFRRVRLTGSLTPEERALAALAKTPSPAEQERNLAEINEAWAKQNP